jgi:hypothetical protein
LLLTTCYSVTSLLVQFTNSHLAASIAAAAALRGDLVRLETYFAEDGRLTTRRDWRITNADTGEFLGAATRWAVADR